MDDEVAMALRLGIDPGSAQLVAVAPTSTRQGSIVWYADTRRAVLPDIMH